MGATESAPLDELAAATRGAPTVRLVAMRPRPRVPPAVPARVARWTTTPALATLARRSGRPASARGCARLSPPRPEQLRPGASDARAGYYGTDADLASHRSRESYLSMGPRAMHKQRVSRSSTRAPVSTAARPKRGDERGDDARRGTHDAGYLAALLDAADRVDVGYNARCPDSVLDRQHPSRPQPRAPPRARSQRGAEAESSTSIASGRPRAVGVLPMDTLLETSRAMKTWLAGGPDRIVCLHAGGGARCGAPACCDSSPRVTCVTRVERASSRRRRSTRYRPRRRRNARGSWGTGTRGAAGRLTGRRIPPRRGARARETARRRREAEAPDSRPRGTRLASIPRRNLSSFRSAHRRVHRHRRAETLRPVVSDGGRRVRPRTVDAAEWRARELGRRTRGRRVAMRTSRVRTSRRARGDGRGGCCPYVLVHLPRRARGCEFFAGRVRPARASPAPRTDDTSPATRSSSPPERDDGKPARVSRTGGWNCSECGVGVRVRGDVVVSVYHWTGDESRDETVPVATFAFSHRSSTFVGERAAKFRTGSNARDAAVADDGSRRRTRSRMSVLAVLLGVELEVGEVLAAERTPRRAPRRTPRRARASLGRRVARVGGVGTTATGPRFQTRRTRCVRRRRRKTDRRADIERWRSAVSDTFADAVDDDASEDEVLTRRRKPTTNTPPRDEYSPRRRNPRRPCLETMGIRASRARKSRKSRRRFEGAETRLKEGASGCKTPWRYAR